MAGDMLGGGGSGDVVLCGVSRGIVGSGRAPGRGRGRVGDVGSGRFRGVLNGDVCGESGLGGTVGGGVSNRGGVAGMPCRIGDDRPYGNRSCALGEATTWPAG